MVVVPSFAEFSRLSLVTGAPKKTNWKTRRFNTINESYGTEFKANVIANPDYVFVVSASRTPVNLKCVRPGPVAPL